MKQLLRIVVVVVAFAAAPAAAGTESDPEVTDACGAQQPLVEESDICSGWFETLWSQPDGTSHPAELEGIRASLRMAADVAHQPAHVTYLMSWSVGSCVQEWLTRFEADRATRAGILRTRCGGGDTIATTLAPEDVTFSGRTVTVALRLDGALSGVADQFSVGQLLVAPTARTWFSANSSLGVQQTVEADWTAPGETFVIGGDKPGT